MKTVKINKFIEPTCKLYNQEGEIGDIESELSLNDVLVQIKQQKLNGYYIMFDNNRINISDDGKVDAQPKGFYGDKIEEQLTYLLGF